ncbi:MAG TPA: hypothetical protein VM283_03130, partial [Armatimonadota bacterium]|nr:hypothetical protein [Armatimonadota bacterium]
ALALIDRLFETPVITVPRAAKMLGVAYPTARGLVHGLQKMGIVSQLNRPGRTQFYRATRLLDVLHRAALSPGEQA